MNQKIIVDCKWCEKGNNPFSYKNTDQMNTYIDLALSEDKSLNILGIILWGVGKENEQYKYFKDQQNHFNKLNNKIRVLRMVDLDSSVEEIEQNLNELASLSWESFI